MRHALALLVLLTAIVSTGCKQQKVEEAGPDYSRQLPPGASALRLITDPKRMPDLGAPYRNRTELLADALERSESWFKKPSSETFYPFEGITHEQAHASVIAMRHLLQSSANENEFTARVKEQFDVYESVGYNNEGIVLYTGYFSPIFNGSRTRTARYTSPLYRRPIDLVTDPLTGEPRGRDVGGGRIEPYPSRREIEESRMLEGTEIAWVEDAMAAYTIHVNGSAKIRLEDGSIMYLGYAGKTDRPYYGLGRSMMDAGMLKADELSLPNVRKQYRIDPKRVQELMYRNESYVFFSEYEGGNWPAGSLGVKVTAEATLATDKKIYPRACPVLVDTQAVNLSNAKLRFQKFMVDQDTGGAIRAPGRADIYMGEGAIAEVLAGGQYAEGRLYYFILKEQFVPEYLPSAAPVM